MTYEEAHEAVMRLAEDLTARAQAKLPSERELAARLQMSRTTVRKVLADLEERGIVRRVQGRAGGAFLTGVDTSLKGPEQVQTQGIRRKVHRDLNRVSGVPEMLKSQGFRSGTRVIAAALEPPLPEVAEFLGLRPGDMAASILRLRFADGDSLSLERMYVSSRRFPTLIECDLQGSMYELFEARFGATVGRVEETIEAAPAPSQVAELLGCSDGDPLLKLTRRAHDSEGVPLEYSVDLFRSDRTRLTVHTSNPAHRVRSEAAELTNVTTAGPFTRT
ncbi:GntR family transcriptional regulator [Streptomyces sp. NPDC087263]|uniref:GntR family transcriptional regulator n=1 Tax=Streptomyces sp. NPDC087263 TaxID=3365773 RepID=UPI003819E0A7